MKKQFDVMQQHKLLRLKTTGQEIWDAYIGGFKPNQNPVFRDPNSSEANANNDKNFIRRYGNIVAITPDYKIISMFDINVEGSKYQDTVKGLQELVAKSEIREVFFETFDELHSDFIDSKIDYEGINNATTAISNPEWNDKEWFENFKKK